MDAATPPCSGRVLLGAGPSNIEERVLRALASPILANGDPALASLMAELQGLLQQVMGTVHPAFVIAGTGTAGMEAALLNLIEPGDHVAVGVAGYFGERMKRMAELCGGRVMQLSAPWGGRIDPEQVADAFREDPDLRVVALVQGETSTGALQPLAEIGSLVRAHDGFLVVDAVPTIGGQPVGVDANAIDVCYAGSQKALSAPAGVAPMACSARALARMRGRSCPVRSMYFDVAFLAEAWGRLELCPHTPPVSLYCALLEALRIVAEEGAARRFARHRRAQRALAAGLEAMGLVLYVDAPADRLWTVTAVRIPPGVSDAEVRRHIRSGFNVEISEGLGRLAGQIWRIGVMGSNCRPDYVLLVLTALERALLAQGFPCGSGLAAAETVLRADTEDTPNAPESLLAA